MRRAAAPTPSHRQPSPEAPAGNPTRVPRRGPFASRRRGTVTLWTLVCLPVVLTMLAVMVEVNRLWQTRVHLENALEAAALAAVKEWADRGGGTENVAPARTVGVAYARANTILGVPLDLEDAAVAATVGWCFGRAAPRGTTYHYRPAPETTTDLAVVVKAQVKVVPFLRPIGGLPISETTVAARVAAYYDGSANPPGPKLIRLH